MPLRVILFIAVLILSIPMPIQATEPKSPPPASSSAGRGVAPHTGQRETESLRQEIERLQQEVAQLRAEVAWLRMKNTQLNRWAHGAGPPPFLGFIPFAF